MKLFLTMVLGLGFASGVACRSTDSADVKTSEITLAITGMT